MYHNMISDPQKIDLHKNHYAISNNTMKTWQKVQTQENNPLDDRELMKVCTSHTRSVFSLQIEYILKLLSQWISISVTLPWVIKISAKWYYILMRSREKIYLLKKKEKKKENKRKQESIQMHWLLAGNCNAQ